MADPPRLSIVVPLFNEERNVAPLVDAVRQAQANRRDWELLLVDDGSTDGTRRVLRRLAAEDQRVRPILLARNYGQTTAMQAGFDNARGSVVVSMDGDLQNDPADIRRLIAKLDEGYDLVVGFRVRRKDRLISRRIPSWIANRIIRAVTGVPIRDNGCSLKAYRREVVQNLHLYSDMHRFIPGIAVTTAGVRVAEIPVRHHHRLYGESKYGLSRTWKVLVDLLTLTMIRWFRERPLLMFGWGAAGATIFGLFWTTASVISVVAFRPTKADAMVFPGVAVLCFGLAFYLFMLGFISEVALYGRSHAVPRGEP